jgi:AcrR family transcriptional regulator
MSEVHRRRMLAVAAKIIAERGDLDTTVADIIKGAKVSRKTFYDLFDNREDWSLAVFDDTVARIAAVAAQAYGREQSWREKIRAGLCSILQFINDEPELGALVIAEALKAGPDVLERRGNVRAELITIVDQARLEIKRDEAPDELTAEGIVAAILGVIHARMQKHDNRNITALIGPLMAMVVVPYFGRAAAREELDRPAPEMSLSPPALPREDSFVGLDMRVTYRTVCVLGAIAEEPGASNRQVGEIAGVQDQGQISKLLARLQKLGLVENAGLGQAAGEPNAWTLTPRGSDLYRAALAR